MIIGIDASRAFISDKTGTENYSYHVITEMLQLPEAKKHSFVLFIRPNAVVPSEIYGYDNVIVKNVKMKYLWTQLGLAWETWKRFQILDSRLQLDILWVPAHTLPILRNPKIKTVVTIHGLEYQWLPEYKNILQKWYLPLSTYYAAKSVTKLIAVSQFTAKQLEKESHTDKKKIKVIHEGVVARAQWHSDTVLLKKYGIQAKKYILFVGSVQPRKNLVALIEAFSLFSRSNQEYKLVIAGGVGWMAEGIFGAPPKYQIQEKVIFTGRISDLDLAALYSHAQIYVQPSITEGFGLPVIEAMSYGIPVISSDGGALAEVVGDAGLIVPLNNVFVNNLVSTMTKICENGALRAKLVASGKKRVRALSWSKTAKETLNYLVNIGSR